MVGWVHFQPWRKRLPSIGDILCVPAVHAPSSPRVPACEWAVWLFSLGYSWLWAVCCIYLIPGLLVAKPCPFREVIDYGCRTQVGDATFCRMPGCLRAGAGPIGSHTRIWKTWVFFLPLSKAWTPGPGVSAGFLACVTWSSQESGKYCLGIPELMSLLVMRWNSSWHHWCSLCLGAFVWPAGGQLWDSDGPRVASLWWAVGVCRSQVCGFLMSAPWYVELSVLFISCGCF